METNASCALVLMDWMLKMVWLTQLPFEENQRVLNERELVIAFGNISGVINNGDQCVMSESTRCKLFVLGCVNQPFKNDNCGCDFLLQVIGDFG